MRRWILAAVAATLLAALPARAQDARLLMVGNSYTSANDLELLVQAALQDTVPAYTKVAAQRSAQGGATLADHAAKADGTQGDTTLRDLLVTGPQAGSWDWVVLQDQSQVPGFPQSQPMWIASRDGAVTLDGLITGGGGETVFLLTWGRRDGDAQNPGLYPDFTAMQQRLTAGYLAYAAATTDGSHASSIAPAGLAFARIHDDIVAAGGDPTQKGSAFHALYSGDGSHPALPGSYLAALTVAAALSGWPVTGASTPSGVDATTALTLQQAATAVVVDDPFGGIPYRWAFEWADWTDPGDVTGSGRFISDAVTRPVVRVSAPATAADGLTLGADHDGTPGAGRLWVEDTLTVTGPVSIGPAGKLELRPGESPWPALVEADGAVTVRGTVEVFFDGSLPGHGHSDMVRAPSIDVDHATLICPPGSTLRVVEAGKGDVLEWVWDDTGDDDDTTPGDDDDDTTPGDDDDTGDDDTHAPPTDDDGGEDGCGCRVGGPRGHMSLVLLGVLGLGLAAIRSRR